MRPVRASGDLPETSKTHFRLVVKRKTGSAFQNVLELLLRCREVACSPPAPQKTSLPMGQEDSSCHILEVEAVLMS